MHLQEVTEFDVVIVIMTNGGFALPDDFTKKFG